MASNDDPATIAEEIDQTREEMSRTVDAIQHRLDPERITGQARDAATEVTVQAKDAAIEVTEQARDAAIEVTKYAIDEAKSAVRELAGQATQSMRASTIGRAEHLASQTRDTAQIVGNDMMSIIRQNPVPAALTAAGLAWLWMERSNASAGYDGRRRNISYGEYGYDGEYGYGYAVAGRQMAGQTHGIAGQAQQIGGQVAGQAQQTAHQMQQQAQQTAHQVQQQAQQTAHQVQHQAQSAVGQISANPLVLGALGLAVGAAAAFLLPETEQERQLMGEARERLVHRAQEMGGEAVGRVQQVAEEARKTAVQEAVAQGLTMEGSAGSASTS